MSITWIPEWLISLHFSYVYTFWGEVIVSVLNYDISSLNPDTVNRFRFLILPAQCCQYTFMSVSSRLYLLSSPHVAAVFVRLLKPFPWVLY